MRNLLLCLCLLLVVCSCTSNNKIYSLKQYNLKGDVATVDTKSYRAENKFGKVEKGALLPSYEGKTSILVFTDGYLQEETVYDMDGSIDSKCIYKYDEDYNVLELAWYSNEGKLTMKLIYKWDEGKNVGIYIYNGEGKEQTKYEYEDFVNELATKETCYNEGKREYVGTNTFENGKIKSSVQKLENGETRKALYDYKDDLLMTLTVFNHTAEFEYDSKGNISAIKGGEVDSYGSFSISEDGQDEMFFFEYEYDEKGNWTKRIDYKGVGKTPVKLIERVITNIVLNKLPPCCNVQILKALRECRQFIPPLPCFRLRPAVA